MLCKIIVAAHIRSLPLLLLIPSTLILEIYPPTQLDMANEISEHTSRHMTFRLPFLALEGISRSLNGCFNYHHFSKHQTTRTLFSLRVVPLGEIIAEL